MAGEVITIYGALAKAKLDFAPIRKDGNNPQFKSKYATFDALENATTTALAKQGLIVFLSEDSDKEDWVQIKATLCHSNGENMQSVCRMPVRAIGNANPVHTRMSAITYAKRAAYGMLLTLATDEDSDGNVPATAHTQAKESVTPEPTKPAVNPAIKATAARLKAVMGACTEERLESLLQRPVGKPSVYLTNATAELLAEVNDALDALEAANNQPVPTVVKDEDPFEEAE